MKVVINSIYGEFGLSKKACEYLNKNYGIVCYELSWENYYLDEKVERTDPRLIDCIKKLGEQANGVYANLKIVEIPGDVEWGNWCLLWEGNNRRKA